MVKKTKLIFPRKQNLEISKGQSLIFALTLITILMLLTGGLLSFSMVEYKSAIKSSRKTQALSLAEAGISWTIQQLAANPSYVGENDHALGEGSFSTTITGNTSTRTVTSTGYLPNAQNPLEQKTVRLSLYVSDQNISFHYAVQVGNQGLTMGANSRINGNVYSNGNIVGYSNSRITGDAQAVGTITSPKPVVSGTKQEHATPSEMPSVDYNYWRTQAENGGTYEGNYQINSGSTELGPLKIHGNLTIDSNATLTLTGPIYVTGNFEMNSNSRLYLDEDFGSSGTVIIADGTIKLNSNSYIYTTSATPKGYIMLVSTDTSNNAIELNSNSSQGLCYALDGGIQANSNAAVTAVVAKQLTLNSNAVLDYDTGLASAIFSSGPGGGWTVQKGTWQEL